MSRPLGILTALAAGAALMFYLDPQQGRRRRARVRDRSRTLSHDARDYVEAKRVAIGDSLQDFATSTGLRGTPPLVDDLQLRAEVLAKAGNVLSNPMAVDVDVTDGVVRLRGTVPASEAEVLITRVAAMRGVVDIDSQLEIDATAEDDTTTSGAATQTA